MKVDKFKFSLQALGDITYWKDTNQWKNLIALTNY